MAYVKKYKAMNFYLEKLYPNCRFFLVEFIQCVRLGNCGQGLIQ